jgi:hypothetical protein
MDRDDRDPQDISSERRPRSRTDRLGGGAADDEPGPTINPQWRTSRTTGRTRANSAIPTSGQDFVFWLQYGGWRFVLAAFLLVLVVAAFMLMTGQSAGTLDPEVEPTLAPANEAIFVQTPLPTVTPPIATIAPTSAPTGAIFRVTGTSTEGLFLRPQPNSDGAPLKTLPEGTEVTVIGEDVINTRTWKHIRDAQGAEGYAAADFLQPVGQ